MLLARLGIYSLTQRGIANESTHTQVICSSGRLSCFPKTKVNFIIVEGRFLLHNEALPGMRENALRRADQVRVASRLRSESDNDGGSVGQSDLSGDGRSAIERGDVADGRKERHGQRSVLPSISCMEER